MNQPQLVFQLAPTTPFTYCRICGAHFVHHNIYERYQWSHLHANTHTFKQHDLLNKSKLWLLPAAARKLASYGIIPLKDLVLDDEIADALRESEPIQTRGPPITTHL